MSKTPAYEILDDNWASDLQHGLEEYIDALMESLDSSEDDEIETETGIVFCGCNVCLWREVLAYTVPRLLEAESLGKIKLIKE
jgi:hypothetical protein